MTEGVSHKVKSVVQNSALRVVLKADRRTRITDMQRETGLELLQDRLNHLKVNASGRCKDSFLIHLLEIRKSALGVSRLHNQREA